MEVKILEEHGYENALRGMGFSFNTTDPDKLYKVSRRLFNKDGGHNKFTESIVVWLEILAPRYWWQEFDTYRVGTTKQSECFDEKTEILTENGWKYFKDLVKEDAVCTLAPSTGKIEYQIPTKYISDDYSGKMIRFKSNKYDLLVTPNHRVPIWGEDNTLDFVYAEDFKSYMRVPKNIHSWVGKDVEKFILPSINRKWNTGFRAVEKFYPEIEILMEDWLSFLGIWLSEGRTVKEARNYNTYIYQNTDSACYEELCLLFERLPFKVHKNLDGKKCRWCISNLQLYDYLSVIGNTYNKYIPRDYFTLSTKQLNVLLYWLMLGDGTDNYEDNYTYLYSTVSRQLADDLQELFLKVGNVANIYTRKDNRSVNYKDVYTINRSSTLTYKIQEKNINEEHYNGKIYCVDVPNHTLFVRRNGKSTWSGNSTIHTVCKKPIEQTDFEEPILPAMITYLNELIGRYNTTKDKKIFSKIKTNLPEGYLQKRLVCTNYKVLRNMIQQRKGHSLEEWAVFISSVKEQVKHKDLLGD